MKTCKGCQTSFDNIKDNFYVSYKGKTKTVFSSNCKKCSALKSKSWASRNKDKVRDYNFKSCYGISVKEYDALLQKQQHVCAICKRPESVFANDKQQNRRLAVDHDHVSGHVRGLLCYNCNQGLGCFKDNIQSLIAASEYLK